MDGIADYGSSSAEESEGLEERQEIHSHQIGQTNLDASRSKKRKTGEGTATTLTSATFYSCSSAQDFPLHLLPHVTSVINAHDHDDSNNSLISWPVLSQPKNDDPKAHNKNMNHLHHLHLLHERVVEKQRQQQGISKRGQKSAATSKVKLLLDQLQSSFSTNTRAGTKPSAATVFASKKEGKEKEESTKQDCQQNPTKGENIMEHLLHQKQLQGDGGGGGDPRNPRFMERCMQQLEIANPCGSNVFLTGGDDELLEWEFHLVQFEEQARIRQQQQNRTAAAAASTTSWYAQDQLSQALARKSLHGDYRH